MNEVFVVRVGKGFVSKSGAKNCRLLTDDIRNARRLTRDDAMSLRAYAGAAFPDENIFIAHQNRPDVEFDAENPPEFIVVIGRRYLRNVNQGRAQLTYFLNESRRYAKLDSCDVAEMLRRQWPDRSIHAAHETTPFLALIVNSSDVEGHDETAE